MIKKSVQRLSEKDHVQTRTREHDPEKQALGLRPGRFFGKDRAQKNLKRDLAKFVQRKFVQTDFRNGSGSRRRSVDRKRASGVPPLVVAGI